MWFDAHLDLAYLAVAGRDMLAPLEQGATTGPHPPAAVTLPELEDAQIRFALATIFTEPDGTGPEGYPAEAVERAAAVGRAQLEVYLTWRDAGRIGMDLRRVLRADAGVGEVRGGMGVAELTPYPIERRVRQIPPRPILRVGVLVENADPIREPDELEWWQQRGVVAIGLAWAKKSRYAGGNSTDMGLMDLGRAMIREMDRLGIVHDLSHLSDLGLEELLERTDRPVIASHSNCRALLGGGGFGENQRHLRDETIREIARRGGVVGVNLASNFLRPGLARGDRAEIADVVRHVEHICEFTGGRRFVGLGSDMDGGFAATSLPRGIDRARDLPRIAEALSQRGWGDEEIQDFQWRNWARFWSTVR